MKFNKDDLKLVQDYEKKLGIPKWYRGLSDLQEQSEKQLTNALRDDMEQGTTHRIKRCLKNLGLHPILPDKTILSLLKISRGSALAFLYFILEFFYKSPQNKQKRKIHYNDNEQIIMTVIYHFDLMATLAALEKILPPGHPSKADLKKREKNYQIKKKLEKINENKSHFFKNKNICFKSPYFQRLPMPQTYGKALNVERPRYKTDFTFNNSLSDPSKINWFENYQLEPDKVAAKTIINECRIEAFKSHKHKLECLTTNKCEEYIIVAELQNILQCRFTLMTKDICLRTFKYGSEQWRERFDSLIWKLLQDIQNYLNIYNITRVKRNNTSILVINPNGTKLYFVTPKEVKQYLYIYQGLYSNFKINKLCPGEIDTEFTDIDFSVEPTIITLKRDDGYGVVIDAPKRKIKSCLKNISIDNTDSITKAKKNACHIEGRMTYINENMNERCHELQHPKSSNISLKPGDIYFRAPTANEPYIFDNSKIFKYSTNSDDDFKRIKNLFLTALNENTKKSYIYNDEIAYHPNLSDAVENCALHNFINKTKLLNNEIPDIHPISPLFNGTFFNCDDIDLMRNMLKDAFNYLKKNPKYVLVTLPDAHMLIIFIEFIKLRYGKSYTKKELKLILNESTRIYDCMIRLYFSGADVPQFNDCPPNQVIEYKHKDCMIHTFKRIIDAANSKLFAIWLDRLRIFWYTACPYYSSYMTLKNTFFSYTATKYSDIKFFRVWKPCEYRNMAAYSLRRRKQKTKNESTNVI